MTSWIFQANPDDFDVDGYLQTSPNEIVWRVSAHAKKLCFNDIVYIWRAKGKNKGGKPAGIIASAVITSGVTVRKEDKGASKYWLKEDEELTECNRVSLKLIKVADVGAELDKELLSREEELKEMEIFRHPRGTNFRLTPEQSERISEMWSLVRQHTPPLLPALNALDQPDTVFEFEVKRLLDRSLEDLMNAYRKQRAQNEVSSAGNGKSNTRTGKTTVRERSSLVVAIGRVRANNQCEVPECKNELFQDKDGIPYCEVHHIYPLSEDGPDTIENVICLCPAHHKEAHFGKNASQLKDFFLKIRMSPMV